MFKVVFNGCYGGFSLSKEAERELEELGVEVHGREVCRHDPRLVEVVERLGDKANGSYAKLCVAQIRGSRYRIDEYDGSESVVEPDEVEWIDIV